MTVNSRDNPQVKKWRRLSAGGHARRKEGQFAVEGARLCMDAALSGVSVRAVLYTAHAAALYTAPLQTVLSRAEYAAEIAPSLAQHMADTASPQGIFCICDMPAPRLNAAALLPNGHYLALENLQDPANLGAVFRTAEALGLDGILLSDGCCDSYSPKVLRGSMGGVFRLPFAAVAQLPQTLTALRAAGCRSLACVPDASALSVRDAGLPGGCICCIGNEGNGLTAATVAACDTAVTVPMSGRAESLNAAMAAGIVMWEMKRT